MSKDKQKERNGECFMEIQEANEFYQWVKAHENAPAYEIYEALSAVASKHINLCLVATKVAKLLVSIERMGSDGWVNRFDEAFELEQFPLAQELVGLCEDVMNDDV